MTLELDRRLLLKAGTLGLGALAVPGVAAIAAARGFTHGVASGEPSQRSVMLWTRYGGGGRVHWQVSPTADFRRIAAEGDAVAEAEHDFCVKPVATGLSPGQWYYYRFRDGRGAVSPVGRTRTLPDGRTARFALGVFSCANRPFGWFNAYAHAAGRRDLDLLVHLGDYLYEYRRGKYPEEGLPGRLAPVDEAVHLADYRARYAAYRADPDLQNLHRLFPMVTMPDDHESANDSWEGGAENHQPETEGPWSARKAAAWRANREWLPVSEEPWSAYEIGDLATLFRIETRLHARSKPPEFAEIVKGRKDIAAALAAFRDGAWRDPERTMMGSDQEAWLEGGLKRSAGQGTRWQVLAQQTVMGSLALAPESASWLRPDAAADVRQITAIGTAASKLGLPFNLDAWDGYPAARDRLLRAALDADANLLVLSGDSHNAWAFDLALDGHPAAAEFAGQSVTSPGLEAYVPGKDPAEVEAALAKRNPALKWANVARRGYITLELTRDRAAGEWVMLDTVRARSTRVAASRRMSVARGANRFA
ncbi:MAG: alkaline phosphatase D family protein [Allosphingosinicella sp.]